MAELMTIGQLAQATAVPVSTLRYYERAGLVVPRRRSPGGYRLYGLEELRKVEFIRRAQQLGLALEQIAQLLRLSTYGAEAQRTVEQVLVRRLAQVEQQLRQLQQQRQQLREALRRCRQSRCQCAVLSRLQQPLKAPRKTRS